MDEETAKRIAHKIDGEWTDMLWVYRGEDYTIDEEFLRYFRYICTIICYENGGTMQGRSADAFDLLKEFFSADLSDVKRNIKQLEDYFDCWCQIDGYTGSNAFFEHFLSYEHEENKIKIDQRYERDIFYDCLQNNYEGGGRNRQFPLNRIVLLYAVISYLLNRERISEEQFSRRLRMVNNLVVNSEYEISDSETRTSGNRMPAVLEQTKQIILTGNVDLSVERSFNKYQLSEEAEKAEWVKENPAHAEFLFMLEDHPLLDGQIGIIGLDHVSFYDRFQSLFECDYDLVDCALMTIGFYGQAETNKKRYQTGSGSRRNEASWKSLFHRSSNAGFENTASILLSLLSEYESFSDEILTGIIGKYIEQCEADSLYEWRYYYVKYSAFRPQSYGKLWWENMQDNPYEMYVLQTRTNWSENTYQPFLKAVDSEHLARDYYGQYLHIDETWYECTNNAYLSMHTEGEEDVIDQEIKIEQNEDGIDTENRIEKFRSYYMYAHMNSSC